MSDSATRVERMVTEQTRTRAQERLRAAIEALQMSVYELERYEAKLTEVDSDMERSKLLNWAVNYLVCNTMPSLRIDLLADSQSELRVLAKERGDDCL
jgi:hypothetical protein